MPRAASLLSLSVALLPAATHGLGEHPGVVATAQTLAGEHRAASVLQVDWTPEAGLVDFDIETMKPAEAMHLMDPKLSALIVKKVLTPLATMDVQDDGGRIAGDTAERLIEAREEAEEHHKEREEEERAGREAVEKQKRHHHHHHHKHHHRQEEEEQEQDEQAGQDERGVSTNSQEEQPDNDRISEQPEPQPEKPHKHHHHHHHHHKTQDAQQQPQATSKATLIRIAPTLTPSSDKQFFGSDYPSDERPVPVDHFNHPYPGVQDSHKFSKDYVKDENKDGGEWKAQSDYDHLKAKVVQERKEAEQALAKEQKARSEYEAKVGKKQAADEEARKAEEDEKQADREAEEAEKDLDKVAAEKGSGKSNGPETVAEGTAKVDAAVKHLDGCKDSLDKARKNLDALLAKAEKGEQTKAAADAQVVKAEAKVAAATANVEKVKAQVSTERTEHDEAMKVYETEKKEAGKITEDLSKAEEKLKKLRSGEGPPGSQPAERGGAQPASFFHSGAAAARLAVAPLALALMVAVASTA